MQAMARRPLTTARLKVMTSISCAGSCVFVLAAATTRTRPMALLYALGAILYVAHVAVCFYELGKRSRPVDKRRYPYPRRPKPMNLPPAAGDTATPTLQSP
jgi:hypothetical protein